jgi:hypothetical protein
MRTNLLRNVAGGLIAAALGVGAAAYSTPAVAAAGDDQLIPRRTQQQSFNQTYSREEADAVAKRLYKGVLGREADAEGLQGTVDMLTRGQTQRRVNDMVASAEFRSQVARKPANEVLNQLYRGFFDREPDPVGVNAYQGQLQNRRYTDVILHMMQSQEFRDKINADLGRPSGSGGTPTSADAGAALGCVAQITEKVRNDLPGAVLLRFDTTANEGVAIDVLDNNRRLRYNCNGATYSYEDGNSSRSAPNESDFPDDRVRACQADVRNKVNRERSGADVAFESAGVLVSGNVQGVRGLGFERPQGANFMYECTMDGTRVVNSTYRMR